MGKRKSKRGKERKQSILLPATSDVLGIVLETLGGDRMLVKCQDGRTRNCRVRGKMKRRVWIRVNDIVLVSPWDFEFDKRGDIIYRYTRGQVGWLGRNGYLKVEVKKDG